MALLQAWPGRGFWQGKLDGQPGSLTGMVQSMAGTPQPHALEVIVSVVRPTSPKRTGSRSTWSRCSRSPASARLFCAARRAATRGWPGSRSSPRAVFCLADWVLVEDLGFLGGLGTDPNTMIPLILLFTAGYLALAPAPQPQAVAERRQPPRPKPERCARSGGAETACARRGGAPKRPGGSSRAAWPRRATGWRRWRPLGRRARRRSA